jgi:hypothetical protein
MKILSIDIGIINLGYVYAEISPTIQVIDCNKINITNVFHNKVPICKCCLNHEKCIPDYLDHFIQENQEMFDNADTILIERQPPVGITNVQDLLFVRFRKKVKLVSPNSVHKYFKMDKDYDTRKEESEQISLSYLNDFLSFQQNEIKHDISDAMIMIIFYVNTLPIIKEIKLPIVQKIKLPINVKNLNPFDLFDEFKFKINPFEEFKINPFEEFKFKLSCT